MANSSTPFPVLGSDDDLAGSFGCREVLVEHVNGTINLCPDFFLDHKELTLLTSQGKVACGFLANCDRTFWRSFLLSDLENSCFTFDSQLVDEDLHLRPLLVAKEAITAYSPGGLHPDYGAATSFDIPPGTILAEGAPWLISIPREFDPLQPKAACFLQIQKNPSLPTGPFEVSFDLDKIVIWLSVKDWVGYQRTKSRAPGMVASAIALPVLVEAFQKIASNSDDFEGHQWHRQLCSYLYAKGVETSEVDPLVEAQALIGLPLDRGFDEVHELLKGDES